MGVKWVKNEKKGQKQQFRPFNIFFIVSLFNISAWFFCMIFEWVKLGQKLGQKWEQKWEQKWKQKWERKWEQKWEQKWVKNGAKLGLILASKWVF